MATETGKQTEKRIIQFVTEAVRQFYEDMRLELSPITLDEAIQIRELKLEKDRDSKCGTITIKLVGSIYEDDQLGDCGEAK